MSYARPPQGDYRTYGYAGDPGWLSSLVKVGFRLLKKVAPSILGGMAGAAPPVPSIPGATPPIMAPPPGTIGGAIAFPGGTTISAARVPGAPVPGMPGQYGLAPAGYHLDKATRSRWVRNRRMNIANPRALRRAMRRVQGFEKLAKRTITFTRRVKMKT